MHTGEGEVDQGRIGQTGAEQAVAKRVIPSHTSGDSKMKPNQQLQTLMVIHRFSRAQIEQLKAASESSEAAIAMAAISGLHRNNYPHPLNHALPYIEGYWPKQCLFPDRPHGALQQGATPS